MIAQVLTLLLAASAPDSASPAGDEVQSREVQASVTVRHSSDHLPSKEGRALLAELLTENFGIATRFLAVDGSGVLTVSVDAGEVDPAQVLDFVFWFDGLDDCGA